MSRGDAAEVAAFDADINVDRRTEIVVRHHRATCDRGRDLSEIADASAARRRLELIDRRAHQIVH